MQCMANQHIMSDCPVVLGLTCRDPNRVNEEWFSDNDRVRAAIGMVDEAPDPPGTSDKVSSAHAVWAGSMPQPACLSLVYVSNVFCQVGVKGDLGDLKGTHAAAEQHGCTVWT